MRKIIRNVHAMYAALQVYSSSLQIHFFENNLAVTKLFSLTSGFSTL